MRLNRFCAALVLGASLAACGPVVIASSPGQPRAEQTQIAEPEPVVENAPEDPNCARSLCGCWRPSHLSFSTSVVDSDGAAIEAVTLTCHGETAPITQSDASGVLAFEIDTMESPGCHYRRCTNLLFSDPQGRFADHLTTVYLANGQTVTLERAD